MVLSDFLDGLLGDVGSYVCVYIWRVPLGPGGPFFRIWSSVRQVISLVSQWFCRAELMPRMAPFLPVQ